MHLNFSRPKFSSLGDMNTSFLCVSIKSVCMSSMSKMVDGQTRLNKKHLAFPDPEFSIIYHGWSSVQIVYVQENAAGHLQLLSELWKNVYRRYLHVKHRSLFANYFTLSSGTETFLLLLFVDVSNLITTRNRNIDCCRSSHGAMIECIRNEIDKVLKLL